MLDALFYVALACAWVSAIQGNRTAGALVCVTLAGEVLQTAGVRFDLLLWVLLDLAAIVAIGIQRAPLHRTDFAVVLLFLPLWGFYIEGSWSSYLGASLIVSAQLLAVAPWQLGGEALRRMTAYNSDKDDLLKRAVA